MEPHSTMLPSTTAKRRSLVPETGPTYCEASITEVRGEFLLAAGEGCYTYVQIQYGGLSIFTPFASTPRVSLGLPTRGRTAASFDPQFPNPVWPNLGPRCPFYWQADHLSLPAVEFTVWARPKALVETYRARVKKKKLAIQQLLESSSSSSSRSASSSSASGGGDDGSSSESSHNASLGRQQTAWVDLSGMPSTVAPAQPPTRAAAVDPIADHAVMPEEGDRFVGYARVRLEVGMLSQPQVMVRLGTRGPADESLLRQHGTLGSLSFVLRPSSSSSSSSLSPRAGQTRAASAPATTARPDGRSIRAAPQLTKPIPRPRLPDAATALRLAALLRRGGDGVAKGGGRSLRLGGGPICTLRGLSFQPLSAVLSSTSLTFLREWQRRKLEKQQTRQTAVDLLHPIAQEEWRRARQQQHQTREQGLLMGRTFFQDEVESALQGPNLSGGGVPLVAKQSRLQLTIISSTDESSLHDGIWWSSPWTTCTEIGAEPSRKAMWKRHLRRKRAFMDLLCPPSFNATNNNPDGIMSSGVQSSEAASHHRRHRRGPSRPETLGDRFVFCLPQMELTESDLLSMSCIVSTLPTISPESGEVLRQTSSPAEMVRPQPTCCAVGPLRCVSEEAIQVDAAGTLTLVAPCFARNPDRAKTEDAGPLTDGDRGCGPFEACGWLTWTLEPSPGFDTEELFRRLQDRPAADTITMDEDALRPSSTMTTDVPPSFTGHFRAAAPESERGRCPSRLDSHSRSTAAPPAMDDASSGCGACLVPPPTGGCVLQVSEVRIPEELWMMAAAAAPSSSSPLEPPTLRLIATLDQPGPRTELFSMVADAVELVESVWVAHWGSCIYVLEQCGPRVEAVVVEVHCGAASSATPDTCLGRYRHDYFSLPFVGGGTVAMTMPDILLAGTTTTTTATTMSATMSLRWNTSPEAKQRQVIHELQQRTDQPPAQLAALLASQQPLAPELRRRPSSLEAPSRLTGDENVDENHLDQHNVQEPSAIPQPPQNAPASTSLSPFRLRWASAVAAPQVVSPSPVATTTSEVVGDDSITLRVQLLALIHAVAISPKWGRTLTPYVVLQVGQVEEDNHSLCAVPIRLRAPPHRASMLAGAVPMEDGLTAAADAAILSLGCSTSSEGGDELSPMSLTADFVLPTPMAAPPVVRVEVREVHSHAVFGVASVAAPDASSWQTTGVAKTEVLQLQPPPTKEGQTEEPSGVVVGELLLRMSWVKKATKATDVPGTTTGPTATTTTTTTGRPREVRLRILGATALHLPNTIKEVLPNCYLVASFPTSDPNMPRRIHRSSMIVGSTSPFWFLQLPQMILHEGTEESLELRVIHAFRNDSGEADEVCVGVASLALQQLLREVGPPLRQRAWRWGTLPSAVLNAAARRHKLELHPPPPPEGPTMQQHQQEKPCGAVAVEWEVEDPDTHSRSPAPHVLEFYVESAEALAITIPCVEPSKVVAAPPRVAVAAFVEELGPAEVSPTEVLRTRPASAGASTHQRISAELVGDGDGSSGSASSAYFSHRGSPTRFRVDLPSGGAHHLHLQLWATLPCQPSSARETGMVPPTDNANAKMMAMPTNTTTTQSALDAVSVFLGEATINTCVVADPAMSAMQEPRRFELTLLPRRDPRHSARDIQRANAYPRGLGRLVVGMGLYSGSTYAVRQRQLLELHGLGYRLELEVVESSGLRAESQSYRLSLTCAENPALSCQSSIVEGPNPVFGGLCLPLQCPTETLEIRLLRQRTESSTSSTTHAREVLVGVATLVVEAPTMMMLPEDPEEVGGSGNDVGGVGRQAAALEAPSSPRRLWLTLTRSSTSPREDSSSITTPHDRRLLVQWRVSRDRPRSRRIMPATGMATMAPPAPVMGEKRLSSNTLVSNLSDGTRVPHHNPSTSTDISVSAHPPLPEEAAAILTTRTTMTKTEDASPPQKVASSTQHATEAPTCVPLAMLCAATGQRLLFCGSDQSTVEDALHYAFTVLSLDVHHATRAPTTSPSAFVEQHRLMLVDVAHLAAPPRPLAPQDLIYSVVPPGALIILCDAAQCPDAQEEVAVVAHGHRCSTPEPTTPAVRPSSDPPAPAFGALPPSASLPEVIARGAHSIPVGYHTPGSSVRTCSGDSRNRSTRRGIFMNRAHCLHRSNARILERLRSLVEVEKQDTRLTSCVATLSWVTVDSPEVEWLVHQALQCGISGFCRPVPLPLPPKLAPLSNLMEDSPPYVTSEFAATAMLRRSPVKGRLNPPAGVPTLDAVELFIQGLAGGLWQFLQTATVAPGVALFPQGGEAAAADAAADAAGVEDGLVRPNTAQLEQVEGWIPILRHKVFHVAMSLPEGQRCFAHCAEPAGSSEDSEDRRSPQHGRETCGTVWFYHEDPLRLSAAPGTDQPRPMLLSQYPLRTATSSLSSQSHSECCSLGEDGMDGRAIGLRHMDERGEEFRDEPVVAVAPATGLYKASITQASR